MISADNNLQIASKIVPTPDQAKGALLKLSQNQIVKAEVLESPSLGRALLLINGRQVQAKTAGNLIKGMVLSLKVEQSTPVPVFQVIGMKSADANPVNISTILASITENLWEFMDKNMSSQGISRQEAALFRKLMHDLSYGLFTKSDSKPDPDMLKILIDKLGFNWESKMLAALKNKTNTHDKAFFDHLEKLVKTDIKGLVSRFLSLEQGKGTAFKRFLSTMDNIQLLNHLGLEQDKKIFLPVPMQFSDGLFNIGQLLIQLPRKHRDEDEPGTPEMGKKPFSITFLLEMSNLGPVRAELIAKDDQIEGRFLLADQESKSFVEKHLASFVNRINDSGFTILSMDCQVKKSETIKKSLVNEIIQGQESFISLVA